MIGRLSVEHDLHIRPLVPGGDDDGQKHSTAEDPVTARIRRRTAAIPASDPAMEADAAASGEDTSPLPALEQKSSIKPMTFQERIAMERQRNDREPSLT